MLFNSFHFFIFFPIITLVYFLINHRYRWILLLAGSYYFYMCWNPVYIILIIFSTLIDYYCALKIYETNNKFYLLLSLIVNLGLLFSFKYFNFFNEIINDLFNLANVDYSFSKLDVLLPVGISFYTFQTLSYSIDVYNKKIEPEKHLGKFALYVSFFPQLVAGPIERAKNLLPQFSKKINFNYDRVTSGLKLIFWGLFKKVVIADRLSVFVDTVYNAPHSWNGISFIIATLFFGIQIYCDFSGYSDIAVGSAEILGFKIIRNFNRPYFSKSIAEFWRRWHISLSNWFKDYVYIPLGGNRVSIYKIYRNIIIVFILSGLWHGANWTFIIWGSLHAFYLLFSLMTKDFRFWFSNKIGLNNVPEFHKFLKIIFTYILVNFAWIFFRANSLTEAKYILVKIICFFKNFKFEFFSKSEWTNYFYTHIMFKHSIEEFILIIFLVGLLIYIQIVQRTGSIRIKLSKKGIYFRWFLYYMLILGILFLSPMGFSSPFIYFQF